MQTQEHTDSQWRAIIHIGIALILASPSATTLAQTTPQHTIAALPSIICLLICDDELNETIPPALDDIAITRTLIANAEMPVIRFDNSGGAVTTDCTTLDTLPTGLSLGVTDDQLSCEVTGTPTTLQGSQSFTITATNPSGSDDASFSVEVVSNIVISGTAQFERVPTQTGPSRLNYAGTVNQAVRLATVELLNSGGSVIDTTTTDVSGNYSFTLTSDSSVRVRVRAELLKTTGTSQYDVRVIDNTNSGALYTLTEASASLASTTTIRNLLAGSGWGGSSYTSPRASGPFAILDSIYEAVSDFIAVDPNIVLPPLQVNWSVNNVANSGNLSAGLIGTSFYSNGSIYILGAANSDSDEFDDHVVIHEWGHYFEDNLSRSDSIGGAHGFGDRLDMTVAFGEGYGNALSGIITDDPNYVDTSGFGQSSGFSINVENNSVSNSGWFSESSVQSLLYDFYDSNSDSGDNVSLGLAPLYNVLINEQKNSDYFTSIFSFASALKTNNPTSAAAITTLLNNQSIVGNTIDPIGSTETNNAGGTPNVLPVYTQLVASGGAMNACTATPFNGSTNINKLSNTRFIYFNIPSAGSYTITASRTSADYGDGSGNVDPDFIVYKNGNFIFNSDSGTPNSETETSTFPTGIHAMRLYEYNAAVGSRGTACFDLTLTQN